MTPSFRFPLPAGGTELAHGMVPLAKRGNRAGTWLGSPREAGEPCGHLAWFPSRSGGNLKEGGEQNSAHAIGITE
jgi:hypothetical protein